eukprot:gene168-200_t
MVGLEHTGTSKNSLRSSSGNTIDPHSRHHMSLVTQCKVLIMIPSRTCQDEPPKPIVPCPTVQMTKMTTWTNQGVDYCEHTGSLTNPNNEKITLDTVHSIIVANKVYNIWGFESKDNYTLSLPSWKIAQGLEKHETYNFGMITSCEEGFEVLPPTCGMDISSRRAGVPYFAPCLDLEKTISTSWTDNGKVMCQNEYLVHNPTTDTVKDFKINITATTLANVFSLEKDGGDTYKFPEWRVSVGLPAGGFHHFGAIGDCKTLTVSHNCIKAGSSEELKE